MLYGTAGCVLFHVTGIYNLTERHYKEMKFALLFDSIVQIRICKAKYVSLNSIDFVMNCGKALRVNTMQHGYLSLILKCIK